MELSSTRHIPGRALRVCGAAALVILAHGAFELARAQSAPAQPADSSDSPPGAVQEVVVSSSRISRGGFDAPTPTTMLGAEELQKAAVTNIADQLNKIPSFRATTTPTTTSHSSQNAGGNFLDLRGLGANRTLVLVDGRRYAPTTSGGLVDINVIPTGLIERTDVVTGGASAAWGSDAVAGVVNLILKHDLQGLQGEVRGGTSQWSDDREYRATLAGGLHFADDRGRFMAGAEYTNNHGVGSDRAWFRQHYASISNPAYAPGNGQPQNLILPNVGVSVATLGGLITSGPLKGLQFGPGGTTSQFQYGTNVGSQYMTGGQAFYPGEMVNLATPLERASLLTRTSFDITAATQAFLEASVGYSRTDYTLSYWYDLGSLTIKSDNAFLPASVQAAMAANKVSSFKMGRIYSEAPNLVDDANLSERVAAGFKGSLGEWTWNTYGQFGRTRYSAQIADNRINANFAQALDAVTNASGQIVCRSTLTNPGNGCVPINLFGQGSPSQAALAYVSGTQSLLSYIDETAAAATIQGNPFTSWAGPVSTATGIEYRNESVNQTVDALSSASAFSIGNPKPLHGSYNVTEAFLESIFPLASGMKFAKSLDLDAAARFTDYSTSGTVWTWKGGLSYAINDEWRLRATRSRDIRAPNISELYSAYVLTFATVTDPRNGSQLTVASPTQGNPSLQPEKADTLTLGLVYQPAWASGLRTSLDYYDIKLKGAVGTLTTQNIINRCQLGATALCSFITRDAAGNLSQVVRANINLSQLKTSGFDGEITYATPLSRFYSKLPGSLELRLLASYIDEFVTDDGMTSIDTGGVAGSGGPHWRGLLGITYDNGPLRAYVETHYIGPGLYDVNLTYNNNHVAGQTVVNTSLQYTFLDHDTASMQVFAAVDNLLNSDPPVAPYNFIFGSPASASVHDILGRRYSVGVRFRY